MMPIKDNGILVVDDDVTDARDLTRILERQQHPVRLAPSGHEALLEMERSLPALVVADVRMPGIDGVQLLTRIKERWPTVPVILVAVADDIATVVEAVRRGAVNYLIRPVSPAVLLAATTRALSTSGPPEKHRDGVPIDTPETLGVSPAIVHVRYLLTLASRTHVNVVLTGETGTGKELAARAIHRSSARATAPFIALNCALTSPGRFDTEFFGAGQDGVTGPGRDRVGLLREADGGVLFLDALERLSAATQAKLLRVLDSGEVRPSGQTQSHAISVRFLAATKHKPLSLLTSGELREDLYYRLRGLEIHLPPLRERREDIPLLAEYLLRPDGKTLSPGAALMLARYHWPGNIRQLRAVLHLAAMVSAGSEIDDASLNSDSFDPGPDEYPGTAPFDRAPGQPGHALAEAARRVIAQALAANRGNRSRAAEALGIHRSTLRRKMRRLGIDGSG